MSDIEIKTHENQVLNMKGEVLQSTSSMQITRHREGPRPDATGAALLQARSLYNSAIDATDEMKKLGMNLGVSHLQDTSHRVFKIHYYCWGLFWTCLLKALRNREDLKVWSPELFRFDEKCLQCDGHGKIPLEVGSPAYEESYKDWNDDPDKPMPYGQEIALFCTPCQGVGFIFNREAYRKENDEL